MTLFYIWTLTFSALLFFADAIFKDKFTLGLNLGTIMSYAEYVGFAFAGAIYIFLPTLAYRGVIKVLKKTTTRKPSGLY